MYFAAVTWERDAEWPPAQGSCAHRAQIARWAGGRYLTTRSWKLSISSSGEKVVTWGCQRPLPVTELGTRNGHQRRAGLQLCSSFILRDQGVGVSQVSPLPSQVRRLHR